MEKRNGMMRLKSEILNSTFTNTSANCEKNAGKNFLTSASYWVWTGANAVNFKTKIKSLREPCKFYE